MVFTICSKTYDFDWWCTDEGSRIKNRFAIVRSFFAVINSFDEFGEVLHIPAVFLENQGGPAGVVILHQ